MSAIMFGSDGKPASDATSFPLSPTVPRHQGVDPVTGRPVPVAPGATMGVRATAHQGTQRLIVGGAPGSETAFAAIEQLGPQRFRAEDIQPADAGIVGTARGAGGAPVAATNLKPDDLLTLPGGMQTSVAAAVRLGVIRKGPNGYENVAQPAATTPNGAPSHAATPQPAAQSTPQEPAQPQYEGAAKDLSENVELGAQLAIIKDVAASGRASDATIARVAQQTGQDPVAVKLAIESATGAFMAESTSYLLSKGVTPSEFVQWAQQNEAPELQRALQAHAIQKDTSGYDGLVDKFAATLARRDPPAAVAYARRLGIQASTNGREVLVSTDKGVMSFEAAVRAGLMKASNSSNGARRS